VSQLLAADFMRRAFLAGGCIALSAGLVGYFVLLRNQVFTSDALGHLAFTGGLGGVLAGLPLLLSVFGSTVAGAVAMGALGARGRGRDVAIGTVFAWVLGLGVLFLSLYTSARSGSGGAIGVSVLFGSILSLQASQTDAAVAGGLLTAAGLLAICRPLLFASIDPDVAAARAVPVRMVTTAFLVLVGLTVAEAVQAVGALLIFGLLVTPAAIAHALTSNPFAGMTISALLSVGFVWLGLVIAFYLPYPPSFCIIAIAFGAYVATSIATRGGGRPQAKPATARGV
jgi:zinc/manganese transport system permease protein